MEAAFTSDHLAFSGLAVPRALASWPSAHHLLSRLSHSYQVAIFSVSASLKVKLKEGKARFRLKRDKLTESLEAKFLHFIVRAFVRFFAI